MMNLTNFELLFADLGAYQGTASTDKLNRLVQTPPYLYNTHTSAGSPDSDRQLIELGRRPNTHPI